MIIRTMLIASEGHILTDGTIYGTAIIPADNADTSVYKEITMEEYYELFPEEKPVEEEPVEEEMLMIGG